MGHTCSIRCSYVCFTSEGLICGRAFLFSSFKLLGALGWLNSLSGELPILAKHKSYDVWGLEYLCEIFVCTSS